MSIPSINWTADWNETPADEQFYFSPGDLGFPVFEGASMRVGILISYDRHFPGAKIMSRAGRVPHSHAYVEPLTTVTAAGRSDDVRGAMG